MSSVPKINMALDANENLINACNIVLSYWENNEEDLEAAFDNMSVFMNLLNRRQELIVERKRLESQQLTRADASNHPDITYDQAGEVTFGGDSIVSVASLMNIRERLNSEPEVIEQEVVFDRTHLGHLSKIIKNILAWSETQPAPENPHAAYTEALRTLKEAVSHRKHAYDFQNLMEAEHEHAKNGYAAAEAYRLLEGDDATQNLPHLAEHTPETVEAARERAESAKQNYEQKRVNVQEAVRLVNRLSAHALKPAPPALTRPQLPGGTK